MLLRFSDEVTGLDGRAPIMLKNKRQYLSELSEHIMTRGGGKTKLYAAVTNTLERVLRRKDVKDYANSRGTQPVVVLLTDGFNFEGSNDSCGERLRLQRDRPYARDARRRAPPIINTVGLGQATQLGDGDLNIMDRVSKTALCGQYAQADRRAGTWRRTRGPRDRRHLPEVAREGGRRKVLCAGHLGGPRFSVSRDRGPALPLVPASSQAPGGGAFASSAIDPVPHRLEGSLGHGRGRDRLDAVPVRWTDGPPGDVERGNGDAWVGRSPRAGSRRRIASGDLPRVPDTSRFRNLNVEGLGRGEDPANEKIELTRGERGAVTLSRVPAEGRDATMVQRLGLVWVWRRLPVSWT